MRGVLLTRLLNSSHERIMKGVIHGSRQGPGSEDPPAPRQVFALRAMLAVPYFEKALYELPEADLSPERIAALADEVGGGGHRRNRRTGG